MRKQVLVVSASIDIARPIDVVRRHFGDVDHHMRNPVHPGVAFTPLAESGDERGFRKTIRILGIPVVDEAQTPSGRIDNIRVNLTVRRPTT